MPLEKLTRQRIIAALNALGQKAERDATYLELCIYGGSAMMLAYGAREATKDVDAIVKPAGSVEGLAREVAQELGLDSTWLNDNVKRFLSEAGTFAPLRIQELEEAAQRYLKITRPSASYLLAMKCLSCRSALPGYPGDMEDIRFLLKKMQIRSVEQVDEHIARFYPYDTLTTQARAVIEALLPKA